MTHARRIAAGLVAAAATLSVAQTRPAAMTSQQDHHRTLALLHIDRLRAGADGMHPDAPNGANRDEAKASPYPNLPDPLTLDDGGKVTTAGQWWDQRRPQIVEAFDREVYGRVPTKTPAVTWRAEKATPSRVGDVAVLTKKLVGVVDNAACPAITVEIEASLTTPAGATGAVPVIIEFAFAPRPASTGPGRTASRPAARPAAAAGPSWQQQVLAKGWGYVLLYPTSYQADTGAGLTEGVIGLCNAGRPRGVEDWGALRAWAWGASRLIDYLETDPTVDAKRVGIEGLSRFGKAAAVAMAYEPRLAVGFIGSSGQGGVKIARRNFGEQVENVASPAEYHWMCGNYLKYAGPLTPNDLPVDAHELVALCAPRPVFISVGSLAVEGGWIDPVGNFLGGAGAGPVYELLGKKGVGTTTMPAQEHGLLDGEVAFRQHAGGHTTGPNWPYFIDFAGRYFDHAAQP